MDAVCLWAQVECCVSENLRFASETQYIHRLRDRSVVYVHAELCFLITRVSINAVCWSSFGESEVVLRRTRLQMGPWSIHQ